MATFKFQVTKIAANPALQGSLTPNHVYFSQFTEANSNWNSEMFVAYVTDDNAISPSAIRQGIISLRRHQGGGIYYEDIRANWPPANNANAVGLITGIFGDNGSPYAGAAGFGRAVVLGSSFIKTFDPALGTFVIPTVRRELQTS